MQSASQKSSGRQALEDPRVFFRLVTGVEPFPYQDRFLVDPSSRKIFNSGRKVGKTFMAAANLLWRACSKPRRAEFMVAPALRQANIVFRQVRNYALNEAIAPHVVQETATVLRLDNGSEIHVVPAGTAGKTSRGIVPTGLHFDEAAYIPEASYTAILPSVLQADELEGQRPIFMYSTPFGKKGSFWEAWNSSSYSKHHVTSLDCPVMDIKSLQEFKDHHTEAEYAQEVLGEFVAEADAFFPHDLIVSCMGGHSDFNGPEEWENYARDLNTV